MSESKLSSEEKELEQLWTKFLEDIRQNPQAIEWIPEAKQDLQKIKKATKKLEHIIKKFKKFFSEKRFAQDLENLIQIEILVQKISVNSNLLPILNQRLIQLFTDIKEGENLAAKLSSGPQIQELIKNFSAPLAIIGLDLKAILSTATILDAGCGFGELVAQLQEINPNVYGVDYREGKIVGQYGFLGKRHNVKYPGKVLVADVRNLPFQDNSFDLVISRTLFASTGEKDMFDISKPIQNPAQIQTDMVNGIYRVIKKDGIYLVSDNRMISHLNFAPFKLLYPRNRTPSDLVLILQK